MEKSNRVKSEWDTEFATYFWQIHLDPDHPYNNTNILTGYSKKRNQSEAQDKDYLLRRKITMLYNNGYFAKMKHIDFFFKNDQIMDKSRATKLLICYPDHYEIPELNHDIMFKKHGSWLKQFYDLINNGESIDAIIPAVRKGMNKDDFIKIENYDFKSIYHLYAHGVKLERHGWPDGVIQNFLRSYKELKGWK